MKPRAILSLAAGIILLASCSQHKAEQVKLHRFEQFLFEGSGSEPTAHGAEFASPLLNYYPEDATYMAMLHDFTTDPVVRDIYHTTDSLYHDLGWLEQQLSQALQRAGKLCPSIRYDRFYTLLTADFDNYQNRVYCNDHELAISIDRYAVGAMPQYQYFGLPSYLLRLSTRDHILPDCMAAIARAQILLPEGEMTLLDYAIAEGKTLYFLEQTLPHTPDTLRLRYSKEQLDWMRQNTENVWSWLIQNRMLYSTDLATLRNLTDDAPKTNAFGEGSAPRTAGYIGLQIVRAYMKKSHTSMQELFEDTDSQKILNQSAWRP